MSRFIPLLTCASFIGGAALLGGCATNPQSSGANSNAQPASAQMNAGPATMPYNGGVYDMNGPYRNTNNNDQPMH